MTLCVLIVSPFYAGIVADRRLTLSTGQIFEEDAGKFGLVVYRGTSMIYSFSGLARYRDFDFRTWLADTLMLSGQAANPGHSIQFLHQALTDKFQEFPNWIDKRVTVALCGLIEVERGRYVGFAGRLSNFDDFEGTISERALENFTFSIEIGIENIRALSIGSGSLLDDEWDEVLEIASNGGSPNVLTSRIAAHVRAASRRETRGTVGRACSIMYLDANAIGDPYFDYLPDDLSTRVPYPDMVMSRWDSDGAYILLHGESESLPEQDGDLKVLRVPESKKNQACPCGSGKRFRDCHAAAMYDDGQSSLRTSLKYKIGLFPQDGLILERHISEDGKHEEYVKLGGEGVSQDALRHYTIDRH